MAVLESYYRYEILQNFYTVLSVEVDGPYCPYSQHWVVFLFEWPAVYVSSFWLVLCSELT